MNKIEIFRIENVPDKGMGMIAAKKLFPGDRVLEESPLIETVFENYDEALLDITRKYWDLEEGKKRDFASLFDPDAGCSSQKMSRSKILRIFLANCVDIKTPDEEEDRRGVYRRFSRLNHSCSPNAVISWCKDAPHKIVVKATDHIDVGQEITINYIRDEGCFLLRKDRKEILEKIWNFNCRCKLCDLDKESLEINEGIRKQILAVQEELKQFEHPAYSFAEKAFKLEKFKLELMRTIEKEVIHQLPFSLLECYAFGRELQLQLNNTIEDAEHYKETALEVSSLLGNSFIDNCYENLADIEEMLRTHYSQNNI